MRPAFLAACALLLAGCFGSLQRNSPEPAIYALTPPAAETGAALAVDLLILQPAMAPELATGKIATRWPGNRIDYYANASWSDELGLVAQSAIVAAVRGTGRLRSVEADPGYFRPTHVLGVEISRLDADYTSGPLPVARVELTATVARYQEREPLASWTATAEQPAAANTLSAVTAALDAAFGRAAGDIVARTVDTIAAAPPGQP
jgi:ABC-type uncharacterized transport system auxiliary subunit